MRQFRNFTNSFTYMSRSITKSSIFQLIFHTRNTVYGSIGVRTFTFNAINAINSQRFIERAINSSHLIDFIWSEWNRGVQPMIHLFTDYSMTLCNRIRTIVLRNKLLFLPLSFFFSFVSSYFPRFFSHLFTIVIFLLRYV